VTNEVGVRTMRLKPTAKNTVGGKIFPEFFDYECEETPLEHEGFLCTRGRMARPKVSRDIFQFAMKFDLRIKKNWRSTVALRQSLYCCLFLLRRRI
jgi:hypothetical protein